MAGTIAGVCQPLDGAAKPSEARASCAMVVRLPANARGRAVRTDRLRFGGKHCGATAIRVSAGSFRSLTSLERNARCDAAGWSNPIERIRSLRIVRLFGVSRFRPPRRSPGQEQERALEFARCEIQRQQCNEYDAVSKPVPLEVMLRRLDKLALLGTSMITVSGGEPLMHPELDDMIVRMRDRGMISSVITNGYHLSPARIAALNMAGQPARSQGALAINILDTFGLISASFCQWQGVDGGDHAE